ncbi:MFS transporter [Kribbella sandramycini]|uniref:MFS family permease n=1 Tax=Kribbella sandramycini TaxID=60450 RepID=A0A7Y4KZQ7_9ACTN|nr:MFS transporter [Kribbella sandramycini]MBB6565381.1 MFS family permease [Kribbella sandramycini]NOL41650.1 MFS transporter [Kribbella sandramycini]
MLSRRWRELTGGLPAAFWSLWTITLVGNIASFVLIFLTFYLREERGTSPAEIGVILAISGAGSIAGGLAGGALADRWSRRGTALSGYLLTAIALVGAAVSTTLPAIAAAMALFGVGMSFAGTAVSAMITDVVPPADRPRAYSINYWAINVGTSIAALAAPLAMKSGFATIFILDTIGVVLLAAILWYFVPNTTPEASSEPQGPSRGAIRTILADGPFLTFVLLFIGFQLIFKQSNAGLPLAVQHDGLDAADYGRIYAVNTLLIVVGQLFLPRLIRDRSYSRVLALGALLVGVGFGLTGAADTVWFYALTVAIWTCGEMAYFAVLDSTVGTMAPAALRGRYFGFFGATSQASRLAAPLLAGYLLQHHGQSLWVLCFVLGVATSAGYLLTARARDRRTEAILTR